MPDLDYLTDSPPNAAVPLVELDGRPIPQDRAYLRNSFRLPDAGAVSGDVDVVLPGRPTRTLNLDDLSRLDQVEVDLVLECAGNGRSMMRPAVSGLEWGFGGASPVRCGGVRLIDALQEVPEGVKEIVLTGFDIGTVWPEGDVHYQFSVPVELVLDGSALLMTRWGEEPLGLEHGGPVRFVMPGHYAMRSVKWLTTIEGVTGPFTGHFVNRYRYLGDEELGEGAPVAEIRVRSIIARPTQGELVPAGALVLSGSAWSGTGEVARVSVSMDRGETWQEAVVTPGSGPLAAISWRHEVVIVPGRHVVMARASDNAGNAQPLLPRWNKNGYANNMAHSVMFEAE